ncbi:Cof-type HAD-IIB family hydrolase [Bacillus sp. FSL K6-0067]|uniref:Cof-type HAD-IIB family hydrolase n=1 Tax=Bacillus sp. FSL K6-0067 TaxID=2921412 RepID=UPI00077A6C51|nr:Cof-type HAD-IIB family hydrolase [Bacillus cereus]KXY35213.1 HAD family hydrolase [Bacillus cereus]
MIKLFISDIDGTMMSHSGKIQEEDVLAIQDLMNQNVGIAFASGRLDNEIIELMNNINGKFHRISINGVCVYTHENKQLLSSQITPEILPELLKITSGENYIRYVCDESNYYIEEKTTLIQQIEKKIALASVEEPNLLNKVNKTIFPNKISIGGNKEEIIVLKDKLEQIFKGKISTFISAEQVLDIMPAQISKGAAISVLLEELKLAPEEIACIGDSYNDIPMFSLTPHSFAMSTANREVKQHANYVVNSVKEAINQVIVYNTK